VTGPGENRNHQASERWALREVRGWGPDRIAAEIEGLTSSEQAARREAEAAERDTRDPAMSREQIDRATAALAFHSSEAEIYRRLREGLLAGHRPKDVGYGRRSPLPHLDRPPAARPSRPEPEPPDHGAPHHPTPEPRPRRSLFRRPRVRPNTKTAATTRTENQLP